MNPNSGAVSNTGYHSIYTLPYIIHSNKAPIAVHFKNGVMSL
ncbi:hypothetical protein V6Z11_D05G167000 [Gossypium hirsutum]